MGIYINGMDMPNNCSECRLCYDLINCSVTEHILDFATMDEKRMDSCPLSVEALSEPSGDLISRADAIEAMGEEPLVWLDTAEEWAEHDAWVLHLSALKALPSAEAEWIPCSERLPKAEYGEGDCVLATCCWKSDTTIRWDEKLYFNGGNWCYPTGEYFTHKVIAWMPLPKPYRKGGEA